MALIEELERSGTWLFRWRSYLPLVLILLFLLVLRDYQVPDARWDSLWEILCLTVSLFGLGIRILTIGQTPGGTSGRNTKRQIAETLNTTGIYSVVRNPLYLGNFFMSLGVALFPRLWWLTLIFILSFCLFYERIILAEESYLRKKFGDEYLAWAEATPVFIPRLGSYRKSSLLFSWKRVFRREYNGLFAVILVLFAFDAAGDLIATGRFEIDLMWAILLGVGLLVMIVARTLKKKTHLLDIEGR